MPDKVSKEEINEMVEGCIKSIREGKHLSTEQMRKYPMVLRVAAELQGQDFRGKRTWFAAGATPQSLLLDAMNAGLIEKPEHRLFVGKWRTLLELESSLQALRHTHRGKFAEAVGPILNSPIEAREAHFRGLSGIKFLQLLEAHRQWDEVDFKLLKVQRRLQFGKGISQKKRKEYEAEFKKLERQWEELRKKRNREMKKLSTQIRGQLELKFSMPTGVERLAMTLRQDGLPQRERRIIQKYLDFWRKKRLKTRTPRKAAVRNPRK